MKDLSLYILDITMNSVRAEATLISITLEVIDGWLTVTVADNGCGMTKEQVEKLADPFFTTRTTRKVGLGVPFLRMLAEQTGGNVTVTSVPRVLTQADSENEETEHGTTICARFNTEHIDFIPIGNLTETILTLVQGSPLIDFVFSHMGGGTDVHMDTREMRAILGDEISLASYEVLGFIRGYLEDQYSQK